MEIIENVHLNFFCNIICSKCLPRSTIQRARYNLNHEHTTCSSNLNNVITSNCTPNLSNNNNLFYSTTKNKLSSAPNRSNLDSDSTIENKNTECIEFERLNKFDNGTKRSNCDHDCEYSICLLNTQINALTTTSFRPVLDCLTSLHANRKTKRLKETYIDNRLFKTNLIDNLDNKNQVTNLLYLTIKFSSLIINQHLIKLPIKRINKTIAFKSLKGEAVKIRRGGNLEHQHACIRL